MDLRNAKGIGIEIANGASARRCVGGIARHQLYGGCVIQEVRKRNCARSSRRIIARDNADLRCTDRRAIILLDQPDTADVEQAATCDVGQADRPASRDGNRASARFIIIEWAHGQATGFRRTHGDIPRRPCFELEDI